MSDVKSIKDFLCRFPERKIEYKYHNEWAIFYNIIHNNGKVETCRCPMKSYIRWNRDKKLEELGL